MASDLPLINIPDAAIEAGAHAMAESVALDPTELGAFNLAHVCLEAAVHGGRHTGCPRCAVRAPPAG